jgi:hypothetical protein
MSLLLFMRQKAIEKGIRICPYCGKEDISYGLNGTCFECNNPIERNPKEKSLLFALEVYTEFLEKYDEYLNAEDKNLLLKSLKGLIYSWSKKNIIANEDIIRIQTVVKDVKRIGGNQLGAAFYMDGEEPKVQLVQNYHGMAGDPMTRVKSLGGVILSIQFILNYKVSNEFVL